MTIKISVQAEDFNGNKIYFILENGRWSSMTHSCIPTAFSNYSENAAELYIALANCEDRLGAIRAISKHANYLKKGSVK